MDLVAALWQRLWQPESTIVGGLLGALAMHVWQKFRSRMSVLSWAVTYQHVASSGPDFPFGRLQVTLNDRPAGNLKMCLLDVENESGTDLADLEINLTFKDGAHFLGGTGIIAGSTNLLPLSNRFNDLANQFLALPEEQRAEHPTAAYLITRRDFRIPVLNRYTRAHFALLISTQTVADPILSVACDHRGLRVKARPAAGWYRGIVFGVPMLRAALTGLTIALLITVAAALAVKSPWVVAVVVFPLTAVATLVGTAVIRFGRLLVRWFG